ncbi:hypothetical protein GQ607_015627 [Colletotrichum asianum]|uniref:Uncharacterized protein n=1 Tax=Colletotrichum asianum TaxID=702518 RepID=A0A8H3ZMK7_9PEZI|nr:hypothetical protein GQ607_015627 [Colletotrichum asianum]
MASCTSLSTSTLRPVPRVGPERGPPIPRVAMTPYFLFLLAARPPAPLSLKASAPPNDTHEIESQLSSTCIPGPLAGVAWGLKKAANPQYPLSLPNNALFIDFYRMVVSLQHHRLSLYPSLVNALDRIQILFHLDPVIRETYGQVTPLHYFRPPVRHPKRPDPP